MQKKTLCSIVVLCVLVSTIGFAQTTRFVAVGDSRGGDNGINGTILPELATAIIAEDPALVGRFISSLTYFSGFRPRVSLSPRRGIGLVCS